MLQAVHVFAVVEHDLHPVIVEGTPESYEKGKISKIKVERSGRPKWAKIAKEIEGRSDNQLRSRYSSIIKKLERQSLPITKETMIQAASELRKGMKCHQKKHQSHHSTESHGYLPLLPFGDNDETTLSVEEEQSTISLSLSHQ